MTQVREKLVQKAKSPANLNYLKQVNGLVLLPDIL